MLSYEDKFNEGAIGLVTVGVNNVIYGPTKRYINIAEMILQGTNKKPIKVKITLITEPAAFGETMYPPITSGGFTTSVIEQLRQMEADNERAIS